MKDTERGKIVAGRYELEKLLGQGGMGEVWVANDRTSGGKIALKLLKSDAAASKEQRGRFEREARIARTIVSPHITRVLDSGVDDEGAPYMALELLEGEDLQKRIKSEKVLPVDFVVNLAIEVGRALHVAHTAGLVHRDLKPANIFLAQQSGSVVAKVLDFGIAKGNAESTEFTTAGEMLGTASYMSPEQIRNAKTVNHQADLWALAVVLFRALTGEFPFVETGFDLFLALTADPLPTPRRITSLVPTLPAPLNVFFERAFTRDVAQRYSNASAMVVGFCRAAGVTVPPDILSAAASPPPLRGLPHDGAPGRAGAPSAPNPGSGQYPAVAPPLSGQYPAVAPPLSGQYPAVAPPLSGQYPAVAPPLSGQYPPISGQPISGQPTSGQPISGQPISGQPISGQPISGQPISRQTPSGLHAPLPAPEAPPHSEPQGLSGTLMLDSAPDLAASLAGRGPTPAAGQPASLDEPMEIDPDEPDNAATLFYLPGQQTPMDIRPGPTATSMSAFNAPPDRPQAFTAPLDAARAAAAQADGAPRQDTPQPAFGEPQVLSPAVPAPYDLGPGARATPAARPNRGAGLFLLIIVIVLLGGAAFAVLFLMKG